MKKIENSECLCDFGEMIRGRREALGLLQEDVAQQVGINRTYYGKIEAGLRNIPFVTAMKICQVLKIDISDFIKTHI